MYKHYCKDSNCQGHTKSWERCCDMRAFATRQTIKNNPFQPTSAFGRTTTHITPARKPSFA